MANFCYGCPRVIQGHEWQGYDVKCFIHIIMCVSHFVMEGSVLVNKEDAAWVAVEPSNCKGSSFIHM